jgi:hypothetical protein
VVFKIELDGAVCCSHTRDKMTTVFQNIHDVRSNESRVTISLDGLVRETYMGSNITTIWTSVKDWFANLQEKGAVGAILTYRLDHIIIPVWQEQQQEQRRQQVQTR